jgi:hypothetical protein
LNGPLLEKLYYYSRVSWFQATILVAGAIANPLTGKLFTTIGGAAVADPGMD